MSLFVDLLNRVHNKTISDFHFDTLPWNVGVWIKEMCDLFQEELDNKVNKVNFRVERGGYNDRGDFVFPDEPE